MNQFKTGEKQTMQISNDAFFYLYEEEEPLDENNLEEAQEIINMFPCGFYLEDDWKFVENSDLIECTIVPYIEDNVDFDEYQQLTNYIQMQIKWLSPNVIRVWLLNSKKNTREIYGEFRVYKNPYGHLCFHTGDQSADFKTGQMSLYFLKHFKKV